MTGVLIMGGAGLILGLIMLAYFKHEDKKQQKPHE